MQKMLFAACLLLASAAAFAQKPARPNQHLLVLPAGTSVSLTLASQPSALPAVGSALALMAVADVVVNGKIVVAAGSPAIGRIRENGANGLVLVPEMVEAADGRMLFLAAAPMPLGDCCPSASVPARVLRDTTLNVAVAP